ncbi:MAG: tRNA dihydrouridine synthase DusB [Sedimenticola sp.]|nr:MAG: tRNA dihydrouridine synthase DusB [Sedimenticola sp.]
MHIGTIQLENNLLLAPMAGVTDRPFRQLCRKLGAGMAVSEMVSANSTLWGTKKTIKRLDFTGEPGPISVQILGADPRMMAEAARINVGHGAQIIDINMGCPAKKVCKVAAGSALLQNEALVADILKEVVEAVDVPVTLKIRTGWSRAEKNALKIARIAEDAGIQALAIHGRTRECGFSGQAEHQTIHEIKQQIGIPVIANGDINSPETAQQVLNDTGADGIMIGRAAQGRPWIFREIAHYLNTGEKLAPATPEWIRETLKGHLQNLYAFYGEYLGIRVARKHIAWYSKTLPGSALFRNNVNNSNTAEEQLSMIDDFFDQLIINKGMAA